MEDIRKRNLKNEDVSDFNKSNRPVNGEQKMEDTHTNAGPTVLFLWVWNWVATIPRAVTHFYSDLKSGEFLARFTLLDAMMQFIVAIATSCHPQEDTYEKHETDEHKLNRSETTQGGRKTYDGVDVFSGKGRTLRSRVVETK